MKKPRFKFAVFFAVFILGFSLIVFGRSSQKELHSGDELLILPQVQTSTLMSLGHHHAMAGILWMRAVVYYGDHMLKGQEATWMIHMMDVITSLDSTFAPAYNLVGTVLSSKDDQDLKILDRGVHKLPNEWRLRLFYAFRVIEKSKDYNKAASILQPLENDPNPQLPPHIRTLHQTMRIYGMPIEIGIADALQNYMTQGEIFEKKNLGIIARRIFHPNNLLSSQSSESEKTAVLSILNQCKSGVWQPQQCLEQLLVLTKQKNP